MKAAVYDRPGGPEVFRFQTVPNPDPSQLPGGVLVRVEVVGIEGGDVLHRSRNPVQHPPHIVGYQCAGTVVAVTDTVSSLARGDRVVTIGADGSHAELRAVVEAQCWRIPDGLSTEEAACVPIAYGTAHDCLLEVGRLRPGETALVQAGAGGVGIAAIQIAKQAGARVLATASSDEKLARLAELGLDHGINYVTRDLVAEVRSATQGRGADVVLDSVGGRVLADSLRSLAYRGRCVAIGEAGREPPEPVDVATLRHMNQTLSGYFLGGEMAVDPARPRAMIAGLLEDVAAGRLRVVIDRRFRLSEAAKAHAYIESRRSFGRVLLIP